MIFRHSSIVAPEFSPNLGTHAGNMNHAGRLRLKDSPADIDLNSAMTHIQIRRERRRVTWTQFHLPRQHKWPRWTGGVSSPERESLLGPLAGVEGCEKVWLGRQVANPEKAALIIRRHHSRLPYTVSWSESLLNTNPVWESVPVLENFESSPLCSEFLQDLGCDLDECRLVSFQWAVGFWFEDGLYGRVTRTALVIPYSGLPEIKAWQTKMFRNFRGFIPAGCELFQRSLPQAFQYQAFAWVDTSRQELALQKDLDENSLVSAIGDDGQEFSGQEKAVGYHFFRWNGSDAAPEREDAANVDPAARESWKRMFAKMTPPVGTFVQERWDLEMASCYPITVLEDDQASSEEE